MTNDTYEFKLVVRSLQGRLNYHRKYLNAARADLAAHELRIALHLESINEIKQCAYDTGVKLDD